jgi:hypothetical protein
MTARRLGAFSWAVCVAAAVATLVLVALGAGRSTPADSATPGGLYGAPTYVVASLASATVGAAVTARAPGNAIGWILCVSGLMVGAGNLAFQYADHMLFIAADPLPGGTIAAWLQNLGLPPCFGLLGLTLLLFPDGRLPSRRWRPVVGLAGAGIALVVIGYALRPGPFDAPFDTVANPVGIGGTFELMDALSGLGWLLMAVSVGLAALAMVLRLRGSRGLEREQLKWIALAAAVAGVAVVGDVATYFAAVEGIDQLRSVALGLGLAVFPLAAGAAILRYRLFDIDVVINRTLVYGALTATLAGAYLGSVLLLQLVLNGLTGDSGLAVAGSTLAVAALFRPARARIQAGVDRRFYRRRYDAQRTLEAFSSRLRDQVDLARLDEELGAVVRETLQPAHVSLWLGASRMAAVTGGAREENAPMRARR